MLSDWDQIPAAAEPGARNVRLADSSHPLDFRIGKDSKARYVFQLDAAEDSEFSSALPRLVGMDCELDSIHNNQCRFSLTLHHQTDFLNFRLMCTGLMLSTERLEATQSAAGMLLVLDDLHRWQEMLRRRRDKLLTRSEIIGLVGEMLFLRDVLEPPLGILSSLRCWNGPDGHEQDFVFGGTIFEIKTQIVTSDRRIRISSEDQLDAAQGRIMVCNQGLAQFSVSDPTARTLNSLVTEISLLAKNAGEKACDLLDIILLRASYEPRDEYDEEAWLLIDRALYDVRDDFPRIERRDLRPGVENVTYSIRVSDCQRYAVDLDKAMSALMK